jgi:hypothetical protein
MMLNTISVIPTKVGTQDRARGAKYLTTCRFVWVPTFVGMTLLGAGA